MKENRVFWLDVARFVAIISVIINHSLDNSFVIYGDLLSEYMIMPYYISYVKALLYIFSRVGVPLFLMISGALLLGRDYTKKEVIYSFFSKNWLSILITSEIWYAIMYFMICNPLSLVSKFSIDEIIKYIVGFIMNQLFINQTTMGSMWYVPMILCVYLLIPIMSIAMQKISAKYFFLLVSFSCVISMIIPNLNIILTEYKMASIDCSFEIENLFSIYLIYIILGYYISTGIFNNITKKWVILGFILSYLIAATIQFYFFSSYTQYLFRYADIGILIMSIFLFEIIRKESNILSKYSKIVIYISKIAFAIYFVHICIIYCLYRYISVLDSSLLKFILFFTLSLIGSVIIIMIFSKNNFIKKRVFLIK